MGMLSSAVYVLSMNNFGEIHVDRVDAALPINMIFSLPMVLLSSPDIRVLGAANAARGVMASPLRLDPPPRPLSLV